MKPILITGTIIVNLALIAYTIAIISLHKRKVVNKFVLAYFTIGVSFDIIATFCMVLGSSHGMVTLHGIIGYSSLIAMIVETICLWRVKSQKGFGEAVTGSLRWYSYVSYFWWIAAYITGAVIVALRH